MTKSECVVKAKNLANLLGASWEARVWNNLGWCYDAKLKDNSTCECDVSPTSSGEYHVSLYFFGINRQFTGRFKDPRKGVDSLLREAEEIVSSTLNGIMNLKSEIKR